MPERVQLIGGSEEFTLLEVMYQAGRFIWKFTHTETLNSTPGSSMVVHSGPGLLGALWPTHKMKMSISLSNQKALHVLDLPFNGSHLPQVHSSAFVHFLHKLELPVLWWVQGASFIELTTHDKYAIKVWNERLILRGGLQTRGLFDTNTCWKWSRQEENWIHFLGDAQTLLILCYCKMWKLYIDLSLTHTNTMA